MMGTVGKGGRGTFEDKRSGESEGVGAHSTVARCRGSTHAEYGYSAADSTKLRVLSLNFTNYVRYINQ